MKICPNCGKTSESNFCSECGALLEDMEVFANEESANVSESVDEVITTKDVLKAIEDEEIKQDSSIDAQVVTDERTDVALEFEKKKLTQKTWFVVLLLIFLFPVGVFFMWKYKKFNKVARVIASGLLGLNFLFWIFVWVVLLMPCEHEWVEATCTQPNTCSICGETEGVVLGHTEGAWEMESVDGVAATAEYVKCCDVCDTALDYKTEELTTLIVDNSFVMSPSEFVERLRAYLQDITGNTLFAYNGGVDGEFACGIMDGTEKAGVLLLTDGDGRVSESESDKQFCFGAMLGAIDDGDSDASLRVLLALVETCDPAMDFDEAKEIGERAIQNGSVTKNGITYVYSMQSGGALIGVSVLE